MVARIQEAVDTGTTGTPPKGWGVDDSSPLHGGNRFPSGSEGSS